MSTPAGASGGSAEGSFRLWEKNREGVEQEILAGGRFRVLETERGRYDAMLDFMLRTGLWAAATEMRPTGLKKDNGIPYRCLNGLECLREMAGIATPAECGPLLRDAYLLERVGFTAERVTRTSEQERNIIDPETLLNHLGRFQEADLEAGFVQHLQVIRQKRWLRGGVYAVDGHDIVIPYGKGYEGAQRMGEGSYGYKLLVLLNLQEDCELVVGYVLGGLQESEITMLRRLLARLERTLGPLRKWLQILVMDRAYWGTDFFCELHQDYGVDFVSRVRDEKLEIHGYIERQLQERERRWTTLEEERQFAGRKETQKVRLTALDPIRLISDEPPHREILVNVVVAVQSHTDGSPIRDKNGKDISRTEYVTTLSPGRYGVKVRRFYRGRWKIENQGFRWLSQTWDIDRPAGHSYGAVLGRLVFVFIIYNTRRLFERQSRQREEEAQQLGRMRSYGAKVSLAGAINVVLTESGYCCSLTTRELLRLQKRRIQALLRRGLAEGRSAEELMRELDSS